VWHVVQQGLQWIAGTAAVAAAAVDRCGSTDGMCLHP
jgi:hypothetical protein